MDATLALTRLPHKNMRCSLLARASVKISAISTYISVRHAIRAYRELLLQDLFFQDIGFFFSRTVC
jgi:hypothetical protein